MNQQLEDAYNEWLLKFGVQPIEFDRIKDSGLLYFASHLQNAGAIQSYFCNELATHIYTLQLTKKEIK